MSGFSSNCLEYISVNWFSSYLIMRQNERSGNKHPQPMYNGWNLQMKGCFKGKNTGYKKDPGPLF